MNTPSEAAMRAAKRIKDFHYESDLDSIESHQINDIAQIIDEEFRAFFCVDCGKTLRNAEEFQFSTPKTDADILRAMTRGYRPRCYGCREKLRAEMMKPVDPLNLTIELDLTPPPGL